MDAWIDALDRLAAFLSRKYDHIKLMVRGTSLNYGSCVNRVVASRP